MKRTLNILRGWSWLMLLALLAGCSNDSDEPEPPQPENPKQSLPLTIEVAENPLIPEGVRSVGTRAAITRTSDLNEFYMSYMYEGATPSSGKETAKKNEEGTWTSTATWPDATATISWYAYSCDDKTKGIYNANSGNPYINFTVDKYASKQHDLLVAKTSGTYSGTLLFTFDHACSALRFLVKKATNLGTSTLTVTKIKLCNVKNNGLYYFDSGWQSIQGNAEYTLYEGDIQTPKTIGSDYEPLNNEEGKPFLFMIPQNLSSSGTYVEVTWQCLGIGSGSGTAKIPLTRTLDKGYQYDVKINIGTTTLTTYSN